MCNKLELILWGCFGLGSLALFCVSNLFPQSVWNLLMMMDMTHFLGLILWSSYVLYVYILLGGLDDVLLGPMVVLFYPWFYNA